MKPRVKKAVGSVVILAWLVFYAGGAAQIGAAMTETSQWLQLLFYIVAGVAWIIPLRPLMLWMNREAKGADPSA